MKEKSLFLAERFFAPIGYSLSTTLTIESLGQASSMRLVVTLVNPSLSGFKIPLVRRLHWIQSTVLSTTWQGCRVGRTIQAIIQVCVVQETNSFSSHRDDAQVVKD
mmetsp:Transcript_16641/g.24210  ORF Transcript_16641/g.24210 Transcript_16641/m.24210 type:complete len:106 (+) Transcript_16641:422-739(+)